jgi:hypothetical protein
MQQVFKMKSDIELKGFLFSLILAVRSFKLRTTV